MAANPVVGDGIWQIFKVIQAFMIVLDTCTNDADPFKNDHTRVLATLYIDFSDAQGQLTQSLVMGSGRYSVFQAFMVVFVTCKNKYDPIKNEGARVLTTLYIDFADTQGSQLSSW